jgi:hypothetical protein
VTLPRAQREWLRRKSLVIVVIATLSVTLFVSSGLEGVGYPSPGGPTAASAPPPAPSVLSHTTFSLAGNAQGSSPAFRSNVGDTIVVFFDLWGKFTVQSITDTASDSFQQLVYVPQSNVNGNDGLAIWTAFNCHGGTAVDVTATAKGSGAYSVAVGVVDVTGVGAAPLDRLGLQSNSTPLTGSASKSFGNQIQANASDLVLSIVSGRGYEGWHGSGVDALLDNVVSPESGRYVTLADFQYTAASAASVWMNGSSNKSNNWIADSLTLKGAPPIQTPYSVTFTETGLAPGTLWGVTLNGSLLAALAPNPVVFSELNGNYSFNVSGVGGFAASPSSGTVGVIGASITNPIGFSPPAASFAVNYTETGLAPGTLWQVTLNGTTVVASTPNPVVFSELNGTYAFTVGSVRGFAPIPALGSVTVNNSTVSTPIGFSAIPFTYPVTFSESGLAPGTSWSVALNGTQGNATAPSSIGFNALNGTYPFAVAPQPGYAEKPATDNITVSGHAVSMGIAFTLLFKAGNASIQHVVLIVMENHEVTKILNSDQAPYQKYLSNTYGNVTSFYGICGTGLSDYEAMTSGQTFGCTNSSIVTGMNIGDLAESSGFTWGAYFESMPTPCDRSDSGSYAPNHNPFTHYYDVVKNVTRCDAHVVNSRYFNQSAANGTLPNFALYVPNLNDDCHSSSLTFCDNWLKNFLSSIINSTNPAEQAMANHTVFLITYDTGTTYSGYLVGGIVTPWCQKTTGKSLTTCDGHLYMTVVSPYSFGRRYTADATDFNVESTIEWLFGLGSDGGYDGSTYFPAFSSLFSFSTNGY